MVSERAKRGGRRNAPEPRGGADPAEGARALERLRSRREFVRAAATGTTIAALGGVYAFAEDARAGERRADGRAKLPPGQRRIERLKPMGGRPGEPGKSRWRLRVHGEVDAPFELDFRELLSMTQVEQALDVHCVTGWSVFDARWRGVRLAELAARARPKSTARHVIFEAAHGYTANVPIAEALAPSVMIAHRLDGQSLATPHGAPVRGVVPDLYFWKSAKWLTGVRFVRRDEPGYWERRGYHNHADPWLEERHSSPW